MNNSRSIFYFSQCFLVFYSQYYHRIENSQLICTVNQMDGFYIVKLYRNTSIVHRKTLKWRRALMWNGLTNQKHVQRDYCINTLSANLTKWSNTLKQFVGILPTNCLSVFDHVKGLALIGLNKTILQIGSKLKLLFFNCYLPAPWPTLGHYWGGSPYHPMLIIAFSHIRPKGHREPRNEVGSLSPVECLKRLKWELSDSDYNALTH